MNISSIGGRISVPHLLPYGAAKFAVREGFAVKGDRIIIVAGMPFGTPGATNMVRIAFVTDEHVAKA